MADGQEYIKIYPVITYLRLSGMGIKYSAELELTFYFSSSVGKRFFGSSDCYSRAMVLLLGSLLFFFPFSFVVIVIVVCIFDGNTIRTIG